mmetsp:Transcript_38719/g.111180  ORF Transcript_38719/g.111180 Transcript_38719/m.111180 type:complete len:567 (-) Transcript_38719:109-1809(-)
MADPISAAGIGAGLMSYNRQNWMWDSNLRQKREYQGQAMNIKRFELYREDVRDLADLTISKMDNYLLINILLLGFCVKIFTEGRPHPGSSPSWLHWLYAATNAGALLYFMLSVWLAMHASIASHSFEVRLLTQFVRLPIPSKEQIDAARFHAQDFEAKKSKEMFRVPVLSEMFRNFTNTMNNLTNRDSQQQQQPPQRPSPLQQQVPQRQPQQQPPLPKPQQPEPRNRQPQQQPQLQSRQPQQLLPQQQLQRSSAASQSSSSHAPVAVVVAEPGVEKVSMEQLIGTDGQNVLFKCGFCDSIARRPKMTTCCQPIYCGPCLDHWLQTSDKCPHCKNPAVVGDGSTGGCAEQHVKRLDHNSIGVQAMLFRVYSNLKIRCGRSCGWTGDMFSYEHHIKDCPLAPQPMATPSARGVAGAALPATKSGDMSDVIGGTFTVAREHQATDDSQLSLTVGEQVTIQEVAAHGWVYGHRKMPALGRQPSGWFPNFCLPEERPPPPVQTPPPTMSPPARISRDYDASDQTQLSVKEGDLVHVKQSHNSGWTFVVRVNAPVAGTREGWVPEWALQQKA